MVLREEVACGTRTRHNSLDKAPEENDLNDWLDAIPSAVDYI